MKHKVMYSDYVKQRILFFRRLGKSKNRTVWQKKVMQPLVCTSSSNVVKKQARLRTHLEAIKHGRRLLKQRESSKIR